MRRLRGAMQRRIMRAQLARIAGAQLRRASVLIRSFVPHRKYPMQVLLNTDPHTDGRHEMAEHLEAVVRDALGRFGEQITRVEAHLSDANSHNKASPDEIHCTLEARLVGRDAVVVKDRAATAHQAIQGAVGKLLRAITTVLSKHEPRRNAAPPAEPGPDATVDFPT
jgi:ribosome-associated translation inhibitor RaiA